MAERFRVMVIDSERRIIPTCVFVGWGGVWGEFSFPNDFYSSFHGQMGWAALLSVPVYSTQLTLMVEHVEEPRES